MTTNPRRNVMITDLDESDTGQQSQHVNKAEEKLLKTMLHQQSNNNNNNHRKVHKKRSKEKNLQTFSGNFNRRSHSAECMNAEGRLPTGETGQHTKVSGYLNEVLQTKDKQMEKLLQRLATLHKFNEQFAEENKRLNVDVKSLEQRIIALQRQISSCEKCHRLEKELIKSRDDNKELAADVDMMKTLVYRLNVQIERYQDKMRQNPSDNTEENSKTMTNASNQTTFSISAWQDGPLRTHTLAPLLCAYDEMIRDKDNLIQQYTQEFEHFTGELKGVVEENNKLQQQVDNLKHDGGNWQEERTRLQAQLDICRQKAETQTRKTDIAKEKLVEVMHCYEQKIQTLALDMEHLQGAYSRCKAELASMKSTAALPQDTITSSLQECKELLEQLRTQHNKEKLALEQTIRELNERNTNTNGNTEKLQAENYKFKQELLEQQRIAEEMRRRAASLQRSTEKVKRSRDRLKARLRIALQWAQKLEEGQTNLQNTWDALKRLETIVKHKESQVKGLHARHLEEIDKMEKKLAQKEETIRTILRDRMNVNTQR